MKRIFKRKGFARWQAGEKLQDVTLCKAVTEMEHGLIFLHGFPKSDKKNITQNEKQALQFAGKFFLELSGEVLSQALKLGVLVEVHCEQYH